MVTAVDHEGATGRSRHFERPTIFIKFCVQRLIATVHLVSTKFCTADIFTKAVDEMTFRVMRAVLRNDNSDPEGTYFGMARLARLFRRRRV